MAGTKPPEDPRLAGLPASSFDDVRLLLRAPFTTHAVRWKVQQTWTHREGGALIVAYIDARLVVERLNLLLGSHWSDAYEQFTGAADKMWCHLTVGETTRSDVGEGHGKALVSDALKRAAVKFGVGVSLYALPRTILNTGRFLERKQRQGREDTFTITADGGEMLLKMYEQWLEGPGKAFGEPFDHGDALLAQGDVELELPAIEPAVVEPPIEIPRDMEPDREEGEPSSNGDLGAVSDAEIDADLDELRVEIKRLLDEAGDDLADHRIRGAGNNLGALRDLHRFAQSRAKA